MAMKSSLHRVSQESLGSLQAPLLHLLLAAQEPHVVELLVQLVAADAGQVVPLGVEEQAAEDVPGRLRTARLARADQGVDPGLGLLLGPGVVLLQGVADDVRLFLQGDDVDRDRLDVWP